MKLTTKISQILETEEPNLVEMTRSVSIDGVFRIAIMASASVGFAWVLADVFFLIWGVASCFANAMSVLAYRSFAARPSKRSHVVVIIANLVTSGFFYGLACYLWATDQPEMRAVTIVMVCAALLYSLTFRPLVSTLSLIDALGIMGVLVFAWSSLFLSDQLTATDTALGIALFALNVYLILNFKSLFDLLQNSERLRQRGLQAQKMETVGRLTGGVAHDFNNILTIILGNIDLYELSQSDKERQEYVANIRMASTRAAELTSQLLAFARKSPLTKEHVVWHKLVAEIDTLAKHSLPAGIHFQSRVQAGLPNSKMDRGLFTNAILNLIVNARDAMQGYGSIRLDVRTFIPDQNFVAVTVEDSGPGIPEALLDQIFDPFFTTKPVGEGSGLGLSMVKGFVEQSGGKVSIENLERQGLRVRLCLPVDGDQAKPGKTPQDAI